MITQDGDQTIRVVVRIQFLLERGSFKIGLVKKSLECERSVVGTEHFSSKSRHLVCQMLV